MEVRITAQGFCNGQVIRTIRGSGWIWGDNWFTRRVLPGFRVSVFQGVEEIIPGAIRTCPRLPPGRNSAQKMARPQHPQ